MAKNVAFVLDIGSSKITVMAGGKGLNNTLTAYAKSSINYSGFSDGKFFEEEKLEAVIGRAIENIELTAKLNIKELTVSVPSEFCISKNKKITVSFNSNKKLTPSLIDEVYSMASEIVENHTLVTIAPIYHILDDKRKVIEIKSNMKTSKMTAFVNTIYIENEFIKNMNRWLSNLGIQKVNYVCSIYCEALYLFNQEALTGNAILIDVGYLTTAVAVKKGKGLIQMHSFSLGGGHIMGDLAECLHLTVKQAEKLKRRIVLSLKTSPSDFYEVDDDELCSVKKIKAQLANQIVVERLDMFVSLLAKCLESCLKNQEMPVFLTGGGIFYIKGAREYISAKLGTNVELIKPAQVEFNRPDDASTASVLAFALKLL